MPLSPEVISKLLLIGHVAHRKSTVELVRNITIKLGYANEKIHKCENEACPHQAAIDRIAQTSKTILPANGQDVVLIHYISFMDCPVMDATLLLIAGNKTRPQPQTSEHLAAVEIMKLENIIILQNKVDLIREAQDLEHQKSITAFVKGTVAESSPIIPISAQLKYNIDAVNEYIVKRTPIPVWDFTSDPCLIIIRSFDVNKPGAEVDELKGGVASGSILTGILRLGQEVKICPGIVTKDTQGQNHCKPIFSRIVSLHAENNHLQFAVPGGLIGVGTKIDPGLCRADCLVGQVLGVVGKLPKVYTELETSLFLLHRWLGVRTEDKKQTKVSKLAKNELLLINIGSMSTGGRVLGVKGDLAKIQLTSPACTEVAEKKHWQLVGWGSVQRGMVLELD
ncbi:uncharacterized protein F5147DRAFT_796853 [Suillus discolor]|uniref:protein-synthesizing GTPase n=1 Tax=Suillus discolor TaxID=1912936 RepID=A0A9P7JL74_9AGAM|nr:uncharacterized protein F5147DRAFT_796853 [Suillus discolor]KAG2084693.1 hypothetical protein F5147DRAFT_796853 [Suillus discolor]